MGRKRRPRVMVSADRLKLLWLALGHPSRDEFARAAYREADGEAFAALRKRIGVWDREGLVPARRFVERIVENSTGQTSLPVRTELALWLEGSPVPIPAWLRSILEKVDLSRLAADLRRLGGNANVLAELCTPDVVDAPPAEVVAADVVVVDIGEVRTQAAKVQRQLRAALGETTLEGAHTFVEGAIALLDGFVRNAESRQLFAGGSRPNEADGTRTRNHRIDSADPILIDARATILSSLEGAVRGAA